MSIARQLSMGLALFVGLALLPTTANAQPSVVYEDASGTVINVPNITLAQFLAGYKIEINNGFDTKEFTGVANSFSSSVGGTTPANATPVDPTAATVTGFDTGGLNPGPGITVAANFAAGPNSTQDTDFNYTVTVKTPGFLITDIGLSAAGTIGNGTGSQIKVTETATQIDTSGTPITGVMTNQGGTPGSFQNTTEMSLFPGVTAVNIHKDIFLNGGTNSTQGGTSLTDLTQNFSQSAVPEPSTMALAGLGALGLIGYGLRRRKALGA